MIFAYTLNQVLDGEKSQTRRLIKSNERLSLSGKSLCVEISGKRVVYAVGKSYAVQPGRGKKSVARIRLMNIRRETVDAISDSDVLAEGFSTRDDFVRTWQLIHGKNFDLYQEIWVLEFKLELIILDELKAFYEKFNAKNGCVDYSHDLSTSISGVSGAYLYGGDHASGRVDKIISNRLSLSS